MVANQAYTFNGTTPNANVSYAPGTFNMGAPFNMYLVPYNQQQNQMLLTKSAVPQQLVCQAKQQNTTAGHNSNNRTTTAAVTPTKELSTPG